MFFTSVASCHAIPLHCNQLLAPVAAALQTFLSVGLTYQILAALSTVNPE
jgi:hypothetical protein